MRVALEGTLTLDPAAERPRLWALAYRMTGRAAVADEIAQEALARAVARPELADGRPLGPWLWAVCANLSRDHLRRRRRAERTRLPDPVPVADGDELTARYSLRESASFAFLVAADALTPTQRAVVVLRDVFDWDAEAVAIALGTSPAAVRAAHHRARGALAAYDAARAPQSAAAVAAALVGFLGALAAGDAAAAVACLAPGVVMRSDGRGRYHAATLPVVGAEKVARYFTRTGRGLSVSAEIGDYNGGFGVVLRVADPPPGRAPVLLVTARIDEDGRIDALFLVLDPELHPPR